MIVTFPGYLHLYFPLFARRLFASLVIQNATIGDSDQTALMRMLILIFVERTCPFFFFFFFSLRLNCHRFSKSLENSLADLFAITSGPKLRIL